MDSSNNLSKTYKIEIVNGNYWGITGLHKSKYKAILITNCYPMKSWDKITEVERTLRTIQTNPKWGTKIAKYINIHKGGDDWDWSEGCITIHQDSYNDFIKSFEINEIISVEKV